MATFITNITFSQQGIKDIDHTTKRAAIFKAEAKKLGVKAGPARTLDTIGKPAAPCCFPSLNCDVRTHRVWQARNLRRAYPIGLVDAIQAA